MQINPLGWSEAKQQWMCDQLTDKWALDEWPMTPVMYRGHILHYSLCFPIMSLPIKTEIKYAIWLQFERRKWKLENDQHDLCRYMRSISEWLNIVAPDASSLMIHDREYWVISLRSCLIDTHQLHQYRRRELMASQTYREYVMEDRKITWFRQLYQIIADAYDERSELEKDVWDLRKLGCSVDLTGTQYFLNFTLIVQPWLRALAKQFMEYRIAIRRPGSCGTQLCAIRIFSRFLAEHAPDSDVTSIDRVLITSYISFLRTEQLSITYRNKLLINLRVFFEACTHLLNVEHLTKEQLIFDDDLAKAPLPPSREIPPDVLASLRKHLEALDTTTLRMVTILLECGLRLGELCSLPLECLIVDDRHEWSLRLYQSKASKEHIIPLVSDEVIGAIQAQQQAVREQWGKDCPYLFPNAQKPKEPIKQVTFIRLLNIWAVQHDIKDSNGHLWRFQAHQFRHSLSMELINEDVPLEVISRLLGHASLNMTQRYARKRLDTLRRDLARVAHKRKTINAQGEIVHGDPRANDPEVQLVRKGIRGQTLAVGGCARLIVLGGCPHANTCLTCTFWLTSTEDLPALKSFYDRAVHLRQRACEQGNMLVMEQQDRIIPLLAMRIKRLEEDDPSRMLSVEDLLTQLHQELLEAESALEEVRQAGYVQAAKYLERVVEELKARIAALEASL